MILVTSDLHFSSDPIDSYRWGLFDWIDSQITTHDISNIVMLGDYSISKDRHPSAMVNRFVQNIAKLAELVDQIVMIIGNHDYLDITTPFFGFMSHIPNVKFLIKPKKILLGEYNCWFLPNTKDVKEWETLDFSSTDFIFTHMTFKGARYENGAIAEEGISTDVFGNTAAQIISGDIHVPQKLGRVTYVGSPYHCHFNDAFRPRLLLIDEEKKLHNIHFPCIKRHTITVEDEEDIKQLMELGKGDQVKIRIPTTVTDMRVLQRKIDEAAKLYGIQICKTESLSDPKPKIEHIKQTLEATTPEALFQEYVKSSKVADDLKSFGLDILKQTMEQQ